MCLQNITSLKGKKHGFKLLKFKKIIKKTIRIFRKNFKFEKIQIHYYILFISEKKDSKNYVWNLIFS